MRHVTLTASLLAAGAGAVALAALWPGEREAVTASSHREAPLIYNDPSADNTDVYAFRSPDVANTVTLIANFVPLQEPAAGPYFYPFGSDVSYDINVDNNGDAVADIVYRFKFSKPTSAVSPATGKTSSLNNTGAITSLTDPDWLYKQTYTLSRIVGGVETMLGSNLRVPPANIGPSSTPNYEALANSAIATVGGIKAFAGPRDDPFFIDIGGVFDLLTIRPGAPGDMGGGIDGLSNYNVSTLALQIPTSQLTNNGSVPTDPNDSTTAVLGIWSTASRRSVRVTPAGDPTADTTSSGAQVQVSRLGHGLVNEVVFPTELKDAFNRLRPSQDLATLTALGRTDLLTDPEFAKLLNALYGVPVPAAGRTDLIDIFLRGIRVPGMNLRPAGVAPAEMLRINVAVPPVSPGAPGYNQMGVIGGDIAGYPNGRRLGDDLTDISIRVMAGATPLTPTFNVAPNNRLGDGVDQNDRPFLASFPYVATPHSGFNKPLIQRLEPANALGDAPLPVELSAFTGTTRNGTVELSWQTATERDNAGFVVMRDGIEVASYRSTASLRGFGTTSQAQKYRYNDTRVAVGQQYSYQLRSVDAGGKTHTYARTVTVDVTNTVEEADPTLPTEFALLPASPNPFNPTTRLTFTLPVASSVTLTVFNVLGQPVRSIVQNELFQAGTQRIAFDAADLPTGQYVVRMTAGKFVSMQRMTLIK